MFLNNAIVNLNYGKHDLDKLKKAKFGPVLSNVDEANDNNRVYIEVKGEKVRTISQKAAKKILRKKDKGKKKSEIYQLTSEKYKQLITDTDDESAKLSPNITDKFCERVSSSVAADMSRMAAILLTTWLLPVINIILAPIVFGLGCVAFNLIRYRLTFGRWPNATESYAILGRALDATFGLFVSVLLYSVITGASIFAPLAIHAFSIGTAHFGGPLLTYLIAPLAIATVIATGVTIYSDLKVLVNHFFDIKFKLSKKAPFLFSISKKNAKDRDSMLELAKNLLVTTLKEFSLNFITVLASVYLSYIPGGAMAGYIFGNAASSVVSKVFALGVQITVGLANTFVFTAVLEKGMDVVSNLNLKKIKGFFSKFKAKKSAAPAAAPTVAPAVTTAPVIASTTNPVATPITTSGTTSAMTFVTASATTPATTPSGDREGASTDRMLSLGSHRRTFFSPNTLKASEIKATSAKISMRPMSTQHA